MPKEAPRRARPLHEPVAPTEESTVPRRWLAARAILFALLAAAFLVLAILGHLLRHGLSAFAQTFERLAFGLGGAIERIW